MNFVPNSATVLRVIILMLGTAITNVQATGNQSLAVNEMMCKWRVLNEVSSSFQQLSEQQCFYFNSCRNSGGSTIACYNSAREINCDMTSGIRYYCPPVLLGSE
jgi:hypothetical protein